jgi:hypothetical protein
MSCPEVSSAAGKQLVNTEGGGIFEITFSLQLLSIDTIERQTACTDKAGDQSSVKIDRQMCPLLYT